MQADFQNLAKFEYSIYSSEAFPEGDYIIPDAVGIEIKKDIMKNSSFEVEEDSNSKICCMDNRNSEVTIKTKVKGKRKFKTFSRRLWTDSEDKAMNSLVEKYGLKKWKLIGKKLQTEYQIHGRSGKQCRERYNFLFQIRWFNHLNPNVSKGPLTDEEESIVFQALKTHGNKWADIAKLLNGRTDNVVKNHFYTILRKQIRKIIRHMKINEEDIHTEITIKSIQNMIKEHNLSYNIIDNKNIKEFLEYLEHENDKPNGRTETAVSPPRYSL